MKENLPFGLLVLDFAITTLMDGLLCCDLYPILSKDIMQGFQLLLFLLYRKPGFTSDNTELLQMQVLDKSIDAGNHVTESINVISGGWFKWDAGILWSQPCLKLGEIPPYQENSGKNLSTYLLLTLTRNITHGLLSWTYDIRLK